MIRSGEYEWEDEIESGFKFLLGFRHELSNFKNQSQEIQDVSPT